MDHTSEYIDSVRNAALSDEPPIYIKREQEDKVSTRWTVPPNCSEPYDECVVRRINDLAGFILEYINDPKLDRDKVTLMKLWARETSAQLDLLDTMMIWDPSRQ